jgi:O-antigen ligase
MPLPKNTVRPGRFVLWRAAAGLLADRPLLGVGPDNYRLLYGDEAGLATFDRRVHANNMYIEMAVGGGLVGGAAFVWLCWAAARQLAKAVRGRPGAPLDSAAAVLAAATVAIGLHGLVDSFLSFSATYILIAVTLGLTSASLTLTGTHAHRI